MTKKNTKNVIVASIIGLIIAGAVFLFLQRVPTPSQNQELPFQNESDAEYSSLTTEEQIAKSQDKINTTITTKLQLALNQKNRWNANDYTLIVTYIDSTYVAATIEPQNSSIPSGIIFAEVQGDAYSIIVDSATPNACELLMSNTAYPPSVAASCDPQTQQPAPTNALDN